MDLITFDLLCAFNKPGCSVCHLKLHAESRYISSFLWEFVTDGDIRKTLYQSLGYCREHAWQLQETEQNKYGGGLGTGIVYEDLTRRALSGLTILGTNENAFVLRRWADRVRAYLDRRLKPFTLRRHEVQFPPSLLAGAECPVCVIGQKSEETSLQWLIKNCVEIDFSDAFRASAGLCLPHLRAALEIADTPKSRATLLETSEEKLGALTQQLSEYLRKHNWEYRAEPKLPEEQTSWIRAVEFMVGKKSPDTR